MNYEEKKELRLQVSQMIADAGINQTPIRKMVQDTVDAKVDRIIEQELGNALDRWMSKRSWSIDDVITRKTHDCMKGELKNRVIQVVLKDVEVET